MRLLMKTANQPKLIKQYTLNLYGLVFLIRQEQVSLPLGNNRSQLLLKVSTNDQQQNLSYCVHNEKLIETKSIRF